MGPFLSAGAATIQSPRVGMPLLFLNWLNTLLVAPLVFHQATDRLLPCTDRGKFGVGSAFVNSMEVVKGFTQTLFNLSCIQFTETAFHEIHQPVCRESHRAPPHQFADAAEMSRVEDGSLTIYIQHESPAKDKESNWLPAPDGPFYMIMRLYWPKPDALDGTCQVPPVNPAAN